MMSTMGLGSGARKIGTVAAVAALVAAFAGSAWWWAVTAPAPQARATFVGSQSCAQCHQPEAKLWTGSHHQLAMQVADRKSVLAAFNGETFTQFGVTTRFFQKDGKFIVHTEGPDGKLADFPVAYTFGVDPLQQYLIELPGDRGRIQCLTIAWDTHKHRWFSLYPDEKISPGDPLHWTGRLQNWNHMCADCHSTFVRREYDAATDTFHTTWNQINVDCEACHGPASEHLKWAKQNAVARLLHHGDGFDKPLTTASNVVQLERCASCHVRRHTVADAYPHRGPLLNSYSPEGLLPTLYHPDGQIDGEVYEYGSFVQSKMFHMGVRCSDCHDPHSLKLRAPIQGNALCIRCHQPEKYNTPAHFHHAAGSTGSLCVNCHMPGKTYMQVHFRRDHSLRVPRPDWSVTLGTPNACNICHTDKKPEWALGAVKKWFGDAFPPKPSTQYYAPTFAAARKGAPDAEPALQKIARDSNLAGIIRATAIYHLRHYPTPATLQTFAAALKDPDGVVRTMALSALTMLPPEQRVAMGAPLLSDALRTVRVEAARVLAGTPGNLLDPKQSAALASALKEYRRTQLEQAYDPGARLNLAVTDLETGDPADAEKQYLDAIRIDPTFIPARINLADLYDQQNQPAKAEPLLREVIRQQPDYGEAQYSLGLLLAEDPQRLGEAAEWLGRAAKLLPDRPRVQYNLGLALQQLGQTAAAEAALKRAVDLDAGRSLDPLNALAILYLQQHQPDRAAPLIQQMIATHPNDPRGLQLLRALQR